MNPRSQNTPDPGEPDVPGETHLEYLLSTIRPNPSPRFHQRMAAGPWNRSRTFQVWRQSHPRWLPAILSLVLVCAVIFSLASPSINTLASRIARFFTPATKNQVIVQVPLHGLDGHAEQYSGTITEAAERAGFIVKVPAAIPDGFTFTSAGYNADRAVVTFNYGSESGFILRISQRPVGLEYQAISVTATVETVKIGSLTGEYVRGGWVATQPQPESPKSDLTATLQAVWDADANIHFLRWQDNDILYEILFSGNDPDSPYYLKKDDLIAIAESMR